MEMKAADMRPHNRDRRPNPHKGDRDSDRGRTGAGHAHAAAIGSAAARHRKPLAVAFALTATYAVVEVIGGLATGSLALLSDAAHMGTDVLGLALALATIQLAKRPAAGRRTYGTYRLEVLAAIVNGLLLFGVAGYILYEAVQRFRDPPEVLGLPMLAVAAVGLLVNIVSFRLLRAGAKESLNVKGAHLEVLADLLGSLGVILGAGILALTGFRAIDTIVAVAIAVLVLPRTWRLLRHALRIIMEVAPPGSDPAAAERDLAAIPGVDTVHELHLWTLTSGIEAATAHLVIHEDADWPTILAEARRVLTERHGANHPTVQLEPRHHAETEERVGA